MKNIFYILIILILFTACDGMKQNPNLSSEGKNVFEANEIEGKVDLSFRDTVYVPIYSDIYSETKDAKFNLTATLSIRNTSLTDSIYLEDIDYYNSAGELVRKYAENTVLLKPMQSIEYVIEEEDNEGGTGANFIVDWGTNGFQVKPIFQGIMISTNGQQGISFSTDGVSIKKTTTIHQKSDSIHLLD